GALVSSQALSGLGALPDPIAGAPAARPPSSWRTPETPSRVYAAARQPSPPEAVGGAHKRQSPAQRAARTWQTGARRHDTLSPSRSARGARLPEPLADRLPRLRGRTDPGLALPLVQQVQRDPLAGVGRPA